MKKTTVAALALGGLLAMSGLAQAAECGNSAKGFNTFLKGIKAEAAAAGVGARGLSALDGVEYQPGIIKKDRAQSVFSQSFLQFQARMVSDRRITTGQAMMKKHKATFDAVQKAYGVPAPVLISFWALETDFGQVVYVTGRLDNPGGLLVSGMTGQAKVTGHTTVALLAFTKALYRFVTIEMWSWLP